MDEERAKVGLVEEGAMATHYQGSPTEQEALNAFIALMRAYNALAAINSARFARLDLTESQFGVLEALLHLGPLCQSDLARKILKSSGNMTLVIDNLEKRGLVRRERDAHDRRYITVHLTATGESLIADVFPEHAAHLTRLLNVLSSEEQRQLRALCRKLGTSLHTTPMINSLAAQPPP